MTEWAFDPAPISGINLTQRVPFGVFIRVLIGGCFDLNYSYPQGC
jgi:hypothetical protein